MEVLWVGIVYSCGCGSWVWMGVVGMDGRPPSAGIHMCVSHTPGDVVYRPMGVVCEGVYASYIGCCECHPRHSSIFVPSMTVSGPMPLFQAVVRDEMHPT